MMSCREGLKSCCLSAWGLHALIGEASDMQRLDEAIVRMSSPACRLYCYLHPSSHGTIYSIWCRVPVFQETVLIYV